MEDSITSEGLRLAAHFARPPGAIRVRGLVVCHGFPSGTRTAAVAGATLPELAERIARDARWAVLTFNFRGAGVSEGDFSIGGWMTDLRSAVDDLAGHPDVAGTWICGIGTGGALAVCEAARNQAVRGVATLGTAASLRDWSRDPARLMHHARSVGLIKSEGFPADLAAWARPLSQLDPLAAARVIRPRPLMVIHGADDDVVPVEDGRALAAAGGPDAELVVIHAAGHGLRHDPRAVAALLGWLDRQPA